MNLNREKITAFSKYASFGLLGLQILLMAAFTVIERFCEETEPGALFTSLPFWIGWALLTFFSLTTLFATPNKRIRWDLGIHIAFILIIIGACVSHSTADKGTIYVYTNQYTQALIKNDGELTRLPFKVMLRRFEVEYYKGTTTPKDYKAYLTIKDSKKEWNPVVSMNNVFSVKDYALSLTSYNEDKQEIELTTTHDIWGVGITYTGYALLMISFIAYGFDKKRWLALFRNPLLRGLTVFLLLILPFGTKAQETTFDRNTAEAFGQIQMLYQGRISLVETYARDFTKKLYGKESYGEYSATQVLTGWLFNEEHWKTEKIFKTKIGYLSYNDISDKTMLKNLPSPIRDDINDKAGLIESLKHEDDLMIFPFRLSNSAEQDIVWLSPNSSDPRIDEEAQNKIKGYLPLIDKEFEEGTGNAEIWISRCIYYQDSVIGDTYTRIHRTLEHFYNKYCSIRVLAILSLILGFVSFVFVIFLQDKSEWRERSRNWLYVCDIVLFSCVLLIILLRTFISGHLQLSNGYETMLCLSCMALGTAISFARKIYAVFIPTFFVGGFSLLISSMGMMNPEITLIVPVLSSKWLSVHVLLMMTSYTLFAFMFICSAVSLILWKLHHDREELERYTLFNRIMLYPAVVIICGGMFSGSVWANSSWGTYWSWDPKETWALITMLLYGTALHRESFRKFESPVFFQCYIMFCFLSILITYFGVNYVFGGLHSYAN